MAISQTRKVTIVGATGNVGKHILDGLLAAGHEVNVITRTSSNITVPDKVTLHRGNYNDESFLATALKGQDVLIAALSFGAYEVQTPLFRAAAAAKVPYIVPSEFGADPKASLNEHISLMKAKKPYRDLIEGLGVSSWIGVVNGLWFDYVMRFGAFGLGVDAKARTAEFFDDGNTRTNFTTLRRVGEGLSAVLGWPEDELAELRNGWVYFSSFHITQREIWAAAVRATGTRENDWAVSARPSEQVIKECKEQIANGAGMAPAQQLLMALTLGKGVGGDYQEKVVANERLGLKPESLDEVVKEVVDEILAGQ
ncbi:hypothetical protein INS49_005670 [Diaporthe citri]|uniref:uncharacterized protein n=1 Tax=Diaporthe citri TaxID=83186 RepID=UPI001C81D84C|nr:uncharacterized protein INS49_005670 [Diaporthe citri]KAG6353489.1 hypothetical protein INS49_005670 [Diaporthe citri]